MGAFSSSAQIIDIDQNNEKKTKSFFSSKPHLPLIRQVAHYTPSSFPLIPEISPSSIALCRKSWEELLTRTYRNSYGMDVASITVFYNEFYRRLYMFDTNGSFDTILTKYSSKGGGNIAAKGAIIIRIIKYSLTIENNQSCKERLLNLGRSHYRMNIRPWQYAIFVEVLINTISCQLGILASPDVMSSWVHLFAFMLKYMLPTAIDGLTSATETNVAMHSLVNEEEQQQMPVGMQNDEVVCVSHHDSRSIIKSTLRSGES